MLSLARMVKQISVKHCLAAVVSNHVVSGGIGGAGAGVGEGGGCSGGARPALGEHWRPQVSWRLLLSSIQQQQRETLAAGIIGGVKRAERVTSPLHVSVVRTEESWFTPRIFRCLMF
jgi:hypothetical protein